MKEPQPILVANLFGEVLDALISLLRSLDKDQWNRPTTCSLWSVKDVALHLLGGEIGIISRRRDAHLVGHHVEDWNELVVFINDLNDLWVRATRRISTNLLCDLLKHVGEQSCEYFSSLDAFAEGEPVQWAGAKPAPVWLDIAREYTERWHHQQQIRDSVQKPGLKERRLFAPVLETFMRALPHTYEGVRSPDGTIVQMTVTGDSGGTWFIRRESDRWTLYEGKADEPHSELSIDQEAAWRLFTKGMSPEAATTKIQIQGDTNLGMHAVGMVSVIA
jgi:uncharacterized protein (TIGR03083 family)